MSNVTIKGSTNVRFATPGRSVRSVSDVPVFHISGEEIRNTVALDIELMRNRYCW